MPINAQLLPEFDQEMANTRKALERIPEDRLGWKPHEKSGTLGWLASHLATIPHWGTVTMREDSFDVAGEMGPQLEARSLQEVLGQFDAHVKEAREALERVEQDEEPAEGDEEGARVALFKAQLGSPKNKRLLKALQEPGVKQLVQRMELDYLADRKLGPGKQRYGDLENDLYFVMDEKGHTVHLTDRGVDFLSPSDRDQFVLPDISTEIHRIEHDPDLSPKEKIEARRALETEYAVKSEKLHIVHQLLRAHALYEKDVNYVVQNGEVLIVDEIGRASCRERV